MAINEVHVGDIGTQFKITIKDQDNVVVDISSASILRFLFERPDGQLLTRTGIFLTDGTDGIATYSSQSTDFTVNGKWRYQLYIKIGSTEHYTDVASFKVFPNLPV